MSDEKKPVKNGKSTEEKPAAKNAEKKAAKKEDKQAERYTPRLKSLYREKIAKELKEEFGYTSVMQIPRLEKVTVSAGVGEAIQNKKLLDAAVQEIGQITGQMPLKTKARKSISAFKVRAGMEIGTMVTLRGTRMYEFMDRLMNVALPRVKDFRGMSSNSFDGHGNYSLGVGEQIIFPEIDYDRIERISGLNVTIVTTANTDREARSLLAKLGMPFRS
jgi:large subunit ribosomal protein L5